MDIPDLSPDIRFRPLMASYHAFSYMVKVDAMGPHIKRRWAWEERFQRALHQEKLRSKPFLVGEDAVGTVSLERHPGHIQFGEFYILFAYRGRGLGSRVLCHCLSIADREHPALWSNYHKVSVALHEQQLIKWFS